MKPFHKILIANRGEIACRVIKTAKKLGIKTVAVYSDADKNSLHTSMADESVYLGPSPAVDSYLHIEKVLAAAKTSGAEAIHPGYGFLSENAAFAEACQKNNIVFIGPSLQAIQAMGSKSEAKKLMEAAGVPLLPGYHGDDQSDEVLMSQANNIGFPIMVKAAYGGGGKGMRVVHHPKDLKTSIDSARREASKSFGNNKLLLERFLDNPRHIEVQIFFDQAGNGIYLFDRDCSLQRRHQKVIEEAPAPGLSDKLRKTMGETSVAAGKAIHYEGAGTIEFLLDGEQFYFMEMNTRLQVEHPVTEYIVKQDLVEWQLKVASGQSLPCQQHELYCSGHAMEARIYAEDPYHDFLPSSGYITDLQWPEGNENTRVDTGIKQGDYISSWYDPMLAKIITCGATREDASANLISSLEDYQQTGLTDNRDFLISLLKDKTFSNGQHSTTYLDNLKATEALSNSQVRLALAAASLFVFGSQQYQGPVIGKPAPSLMMFILGHEHKTVSVTRKGNDFDLEFSDGLCSASITWSDNNSGHIKVHNIENPCRIVPMPGNRLKIFFPDFSVQLGLPGSLTYSSSDNPALSAPMDAIVTEVMVSPRQAVQEGMVMLTLEAMKMEHSILAPNEGIISQVFFKPGDRVEAGTELITYKDESNDVT